MVFGITLPAGMIARPTLGSTRPVLEGKVTLNANAAIKGLNISTGAATGITNTASSSGGD
jgi:hypothetical protein